MCGIAGWVSFGRDLGTKRDVINAMTQTLACRGRDDGGVWVGGNAAIGHRRLAVIDPPGGRQPMRAGPGGAQAVLTYSGEIYNYPELRAELRALGHGFRTASDTEVVLHGYLQWGGSVAERLNGIYAFAVWDQRTQTLTLVRDRLGVKPLYYFPTDDGLLFGSEPKAILANSLAEPVLDAGGLRQILACFTRTPGEAVWSGMREVVPGTVVTVDRNGRRQRTYWQLQAVEHTDSPADTVRRVRELLTDTVSRQLVADVPRCVLLSGGLDSSAITALAAHELAGKGERIRSFAVGFVDQEKHFRAEVGMPTSDMPFVHAMAAHAGTDHRDIVLDADATADPDLRRTIITARDLPVGLGDRDMSIYLLFKAIREHSTVALSGESGDELFGGYPSFHLPQALAATTFPWSAIFPFDPAALIDPELLRRLDFPDYLATTYQRALRQVPHHQDDDADERRMREIRYLHLIHLLPVLLDRKDRMSMAVSLEARVPYCDHHLVEYVYNTPWSAHTADGREKSLLRAAVADLLPDAVYHRAKSGYPSIATPRYLTSLQEQARALTAAHHPMSTLYDHTQLQAAIACPGDTITMRQRSALERFLDLATWHDVYRPRVTIDDS